MVCFLLIPGRQNTFLICTISWRHEWGLSSVWQSISCLWCKLMSPRIICKFLGWKLELSCCRFVGCRYFTWDKTTPQRRRCGVGGRRVVFCFFPLVVETLKHGSVGFSVTLWAVLSSHFDDFWVCSTNLPLNTFANSSQKGKLEYF